MTSFLRKQVKKGQFPAILNKQQAVKVKVSKGLSFKRKEGLKGLEKLEVGKVRSWKSAKLEKIEVGKVRSWKSQKLEKLEVGKVSSSRQAYTLIMLLLYELQGTANLKKNKIVRRPSRAQICIFLKNSKRGPQRPPMSFQIPKS